jgi:hypothetical protein
MPRVITHEFTIESVYSGVHLHKLNMCLLFQPNSECLSTGIPMWRIVDITCHNGRIREYENVISAAKHFDMSRIVLVKRDR